jgi:hypothetical protein
VVTAAAIAFALGAIVLVVALAIVLDSVGLAGATDLTIRVGRLNMIGSPSSTPDLSSPGLAGDDTNLSDAWDTGSPAFAGNDRNLF